MPERIFLQEIEASPHEMRAAALSLMPGVSVFVFDRDLRLLLAEGGALRVHGYDPEDLTGKLLADALPSHAYTSLEPEYRATLEGESRSFIHKATDGTRSYRIQTKPIGNDGEVVGGIAYSVDITELQETRDELERAIERFETAFTGAPIGMALVALDGTWLRVNPALCHLTGYSEDELRTLTFADVTHPDDLEADEAEAQRLLTGEISSYMIEKRYLKKSGEPVWVELNGSLVRNKQGEPLHFIAQVQDISARRAIEEELRRSAIEDPLTGLPNRRYFNDQMEKQLDRSRRHGGESMVMMIDVDDFKGINDRFGHSAGDQVLCRFAEILLSVSRKHDVAARLGGDEFALMKVEVEPVKTGDLVRRTVAALASVELELSGERIEIGASVGWAPLNAETPSLDSVLMEADRSMYEMKRVRRTDR